MKPELNDAADTKYVVIDHYSAPEAGNGFSSESSLQRVTERISRGPNCRTMFDDAAGGRAPTAANGVETKTRKH